ncbi:hypothetical protein KAR91_29790 [Candidatus Pacearchaeota archaeon]|nr:hypothetical protein [Candidatus Pacearchaeota archaeon]
MESKDNPMWDIYDLWRTAKLNVKYYCALRRRYNGWLIFFDITIALTIPSGAVAALWLWDTSIGSYLWKILLCLASICAVIKPLINFGKKTQKIDEIISAYKLLYHDTDSIIIKVKQEKKLTDKIISQFNEALLRKRVLIKDSTEFADNKKLIKKYTDEVNQELKDYYFFIPEEK